LSTFAVGLSALSVTVDVTLRAVATEAWKRLSTQTE
jgi:hypothetical protein